MSLTSSTLLILVTVLAGVIPVVLAVTWRMWPGGIVGGVLRVVCMLVAQALAVGAIGLYANKQYGFYDNWDDVFGIHTSPPSMINTTGLVPADGSQGQVTSVTAKIAGTDGLDSLRLAFLVWVPKQYNEAANKNKKFPVVMVLPGQPSNPQDTMHALDFPSTASREIDSGKVPPFIAVFPPIMIDPPRDTECTDVPNGPQAETWLSDSVRGTVLQQFRADSSGAKWSAMGFSTGGFCAAKLLMRHRTEFNAAVSIGGYFDAETDSTTGDLFNGDQQLKNQNSPIWLIQQKPQEKTNLLIVVSKDDTDSWAPGAAYADSQKMIRTSSGVPGVKSIVLDSGGHHYSTYTPMMGQCLQWLAESGSL